MFWTQSALTAGPACAASWFWCGNGTGFGFDLFTMSTAFGCLCRFRSLFLFSSSSLGLFVAQEPAIRVRPHRPKSLGLASAVRPDRFWTSYARGLSIGLADQANYTVLVSGIPVQVQRDAYSNTFSLHKDNSFRIGNHPCTRNPCHSCTLAWSRSLAFLGLWSARWVSSDRGRIFVLGDLSDRPRTHIASHRFFASGPRSC